MRPGQTAPECSDEAIAAARAAASFNEAGADCPGMQENQKGSAKMTPDASMRPGQTAPECCHVSISNDH